MPDCVTRDGRKLMDIRLGEGGYKCSVENHLLKKSAILKRMVKAGTTRATIGGTVRATPGL